MKYRKGFIAILIIFALTTSAMAAETTSVKEFSDVQNGNWCYSYVMYLVNAGGINGYSDGTFKPDNTMTYAELIKVCVCSATGKTYTSAEGKEWYDAVYQEGINLGVYTTDEIPASVLTSPISREDMVLILVRTAQKIKGETAPTDLTGVSAKMSDYSSISADRQTYVMQAYKMGLILGNNDTFRPADSTTRAEASTVIYRLINQSKRVDYRTIPDAEIPVNTDSIYVQKGDYAGRLKTSVATQYDLAALKTAKFYKENGKYFISLTIPALPDGIYMSVSTAGFTKDSYIVFGDAVNTIYSPDGTNIYNNNARYQTGPIIIEVKPENGMSMRNLDVATLSVMVSNVKGAMISHKLSTLAPGQVLSQSQIMTSDCAWETFDTTGIFNW